MKKVFKLKFYLLLFIIIYIIIIFFLFYIEKGFFLNKNLNEILNINISIIDNINRKNGDIDINQNKIIFYAPMQDLLIISNKNNNFKHNHFFKPNDFQLINYNKFNPVESNKNTISKKIFNFFDFSSFFSINSFFNKINNFFINNFTFNNLKNPPIIDLNDFPINNSNNLEISNLNSTIINNNEISNSSSSSSNSEQIINKQLKKNLYDYIALSDILFRNYDELNNREQILYRNSLINFYKNNKILLQDLKNLEKYIVNKTEHIRSNLEELLNNNKNENEIFQSFYDANPCVLEEVRQRCNSIQDIFDQRKLFCNDTDNTYLNNFLTNTYIKKKTFFSIFYRLEAYTNKEILLKDIKLNSFLSKIDIVNKQIAHEFLNLYTDSNSLEIYANQKSEKIQDLIIINSIIRTILNNFVLQKI
jgi:hypothetical protein